MGMWPAEGLRLSHAPDTAEDSKPAAELPLLLRPCRGNPTQDLRGGEKPTALFSLQKTAKTASAQMQSDDSTGYPRRMGCADAQPILQLC